MNGNRLARTVLTIAIASTAVACGGDAHQSEPPASAATPSNPPTEILSPLLQKALPNVEGKTFTSAIVDFPPAARAVPHRHGDAFVYAYVLDGTVRSRLAGQTAHTYQQGQDWVEQPGAHHLLTENVSPTAPARLLVIFVSTTGDRLKIDDPAPTPQ
jgi:quercetin dioxygenase-like cupin family protein